MIIKMNGEYIHFNKSDFTCLKHYYEELMRIKFGRKINSVNTIDELKHKLKQLRK